MKYRCQNCATVFEKKAGQCPSCDWIVGRKVPASQPAEGEPAPIHPSAMDASSQPRIEAVSNQTPLDALEALFHDFAMRLLGLCGQLELISEAIEKLKEQAHVAGTSTPAQCPTEGPDGKSEVVAQPPSVGSTDQAVARDVGGQVN